MKTIVTQRPLVTNFNNGYYGLTVLEVDERHEVSSKNLPPDTRILADLRNNEKPWKRYVVNYNINYFMSSINDEQAQDLVHHLVSRLGAKKVIKIAETFDDMMEQLHHED